MSKEKEIFEKNLCRINGILNIFDKHISGNNIKHGTELLRASVVMLHSTFENYLRTIIKNNFLKVCSANDLNNISFIDLSQGGKINLQDLYKHRTKKVSTVLKESISHTLEKTSFNNYTTIHKWCMIIKVDLSNFKKQDVLDKMISRRHKIVHEADLNNNKLNNIELNEVVNYKDILIELVNLIDR